MTALLPPLAITTALGATAGPVLVLTNGSPRQLTVQANFTYGSGGTSADAYVQTSLDGGATWTDIANFHFTTASARKIYNLSAATPVASIATPNDGSLSSNTAVDGILGTHFRIKYATVGTYAGTTLQIDAASDQLP
jgi:hypothetical protein